MKSVGRYDLRPHSRVNKKWNISYDPDFRTHIVCNEAIPIGHMIWEEPAVMQAVSKSAHEITASEASRGYFGTGLHWQNFLNDLPLPDNHAFPVEERLARLKNNALRWLNSQGRTCYGIFQHLSLINHSCRANAHFSHDAASGWMQLRAIADIAVGEEITIDYGQWKDWPNSEQRSSDLFKSHGFECDCQICRQSECVPHSREVRRAFLEDTQRRLKASGLDHHSTRLRLATEYAEEMELELGGLDARGVPRYADQRLVDAYWQLASCFHAVQDREGWQFYLDLAMTISRLLEGPDSERAEVLHLVRYNVEQEDYKRKFGVEF